MDPTKNNKGGTQHNTMQNTKKIGSMDPTTNNKGGKQHNTMQKTKKICSMDPTNIAVLISISPNNFHFTYYEEE